MMFLPREEGQGLTEYALLIAFIVLVIVAVLSLLGPGVGNVYSNIVEAWPGG